MPIKNIEATYDPLGRDLPAVGDSGSTWKGGIGMGMQLGASALMGIAQDKAYQQQSKDASKEYRYAVGAIGDKYRQLFDDLKEQNMRMYSAQNTAAAATGFRMEGSIQAVLDEAVASASEQSVRVSSAMDSELAAAAARKRQIQRAAKKNQKLGYVKTALSLALVPVTGGASLAGLAL